MILCGILFLIMLILIIYLWIKNQSYKRNIQSIIEQLDWIVGAKTNQQVTFVCPQKEINQLIIQINQLHISNRNAILSMNKLNRRFRQSVTSLSHDLRTPLTSAGGYMQMLQGNLSLEEQKEYLAIVESRVKTVSHLLEQLFEFVRIEAGEIQFKNEPTDVRRVFVDTIALYYSDFQKIKQEPDIKLIPGPCMILGDADGVRRIFSNIIYNSLVHGAGDYSFSLEEQNGYLFTFANDSEPLSEEDLENIFQRFFTKDQSRYKKSTGLGLSIAKEISNQMKGKVWAEYSDGLLKMYIWFPKKENAVRV